MTKKIAAVFTIVKNENYFVKKWINHYSKYYSVEDMYIIDHHSKDESLQNLHTRVNITLPPISGGHLAYDHDWMKICVETMYEILLEKYQCVMFTDVDEIIFTDTYPLNEILEQFVVDNAVDVQSIRTWDLIQVIGQEKNLSNNDEILTYRDYMIRHQANNFKYDKTLLSKHKPIFDRGHHNMINFKRNFKYNLYMLHLKKYDFTAMVERNRYRNQYETLFPDGNGMQNKSIDAAFLQNFFYSENNAPEYYEKIPQHWKNILKGI